MYVAALKNFGFLGGDEERKFNSFDGGEYGKEKFLQESTGNCPRHRRPCSQPEAAAGSGERPRRRRRGADLSIAGCLPPGEEHAEYRLHDVALGPQREPDHPRGSEFAVCWVG